MNDDKTIANQNAKAAESTVSTGEVITNTVAAVSGEVKTPSVAASTESTSTGETGNGVASAETSDANKLSSDASTADTSKLAETSNPSQQAAEAPVAEPNHVSYRAKLVKIAARLEIGLLEDVAELEKKLSDYSVETLDEIAALKTKYNIA